MSDVVITGVGCVTSIGDSISSFWPALTSGESGARELSRFDHTAYDQCPSIACEVPHDGLDHPKVNERKMGRYTRYAIIATDRALTDAGLDPDSEDWTPDAVGVSVGTGVGGFPELVDGVQELEDGGRLSPWYWPRVLTNLAAGHVSIQYDARGPNRAPTTACAAGTHSICDAMMDIRNGRADVVLAGGTEAGISPTAVGAFGAMRALSRHSGDPSVASRPFDQDRAGFVPGEGAGILVLESREHAEARGASIQAELSGYGRSGDGTHPTRPPESAHSLVNAIRTGLHDADLDPDDVDHVNAHATGTPQGDKHEATALNKVFDDVPPVTSVKSMLGHTLGASGAIEAIVATKTITEGVIPPTINCDDKDPECDVPVVTGARTADVNTVVSNSAGFGGTNGVIVLESPR